MKAVAVIPARYGSSRFPGKPLVLLRGKPIIQHVYEQVKQSNLFEMVVIATDDVRIVDAVAKFKASVIMTSPDHQSGTDRCAEACDNLPIDFDIVVNIQGDEPFISAEPLTNLLATFNNPDTQISSLMHPIEQDIDNPNSVKVVCDLLGNALYFSRSAIPYNRDGIDVTYFKHVGVYAFRKEALKKFVNLPPSKLEKTEKLEQLRLLENGFKIRMVKTQYRGIGIDTPEDLKKAEKLFEELG